MEEEMNTMCNLSLNISEEALNRGYTQGRQEILNETAVRFLSMGFSVEDVSKGTGLPLETVEEIKKQIKKKNR